MRVYVETSAVNYFLNNLNGQGAEATKRLQLSKGRVWFISTTVLWELLQIANRNDLGACLFLSSYLFHDQLLKSGAEIAIDYLEKGEPDYLILDMPFTKSSIGSIWKKACDDKSIAFYIDDPGFHEMTSLLREISRYVRYLTDEKTRINATVSLKMQSLADILDEAYKIRFKDDVDSWTKRLRMTAILVLYIQLCLCLDLTRDVLESFWIAKGMADPFERLPYLLEKHPNMVQGGPIWNMANAISIQCLNVGRSSRGAFHDGMHAVYLPFVDALLTKDRHFANMRDRAKEKYKKMYYNKIHHLDEVELLKVEY